MKNQEDFIKTLSFGCRLNAVETEKIAGMLAATGTRAAAIVNTCSVTAEGERQSLQAVRRIARENSGAPIFVTGCGATRAPEKFAAIPGVIVVPNNRKMDITAYLVGFSPSADADIKPQLVGDINHHLSKAFIQIQNGCDHACTYCITRILRGRAVSFPIDQILDEGARAVARGFSEIVLTGVDIASYPCLSDLCQKLLNDVQGIRRLRLSSLDPAADLRQIIELIHTDTRMMPHLHLSMQSGSDAILRPMARRHTADMVRQLVADAHNITFSWDIICGFPGETDELFAETCALIRELKPIHIHAFPFSPRPGTVAATMPNQIPRATSKERVKIITELAHENLTAFMQTQIGRTVSVLVEENNIGRTPDDIAISIDGASVQNRTIYDVCILGMDGDTFLGAII